MSTMSCKMNHFLCKFLGPLVDLGLRFYVGRIFFHAGYEKLQNYLNGNAEATVSLFRDKHPIPGLTPEIAAYLGTGAELVLPILLIFGIFTRWAAFALIVITLVIEFTYNSSLDHTVWLLMLSVIWVGGPGKLSFDRLLPGIMGHPQKECH